MPVKLVYCFKTMFPSAKFIFANKFLRNFAFFAKIFVCWKPYMYPSKLTKEYPHDSYLTDDFDQLVLIYNV